MAALVGVVFPYVALVIFVAGFLYRVGVWAKAPKKLNWKLYPVPHGLGAEAAYILGEWISFRMLFRHNRAVWLGSYVFHLSLAALGVWFLLLLVGPSVPWLVRLGAAALFFEQCLSFLAQALGASDKVTVFSGGVFQSGSFHGHSSLGLEPHGSPDGCGVALLGHLGLVPEASGPT